MNVPVSRDGELRQGPSAGWGCPVGPGQALCRRGASAAPLLHHPRVASNAGEGLRLSVSGNSLRAACGGHPWPSSAAAQALTHPWVRFLVADCFIMNL
jgi:hypothetical protein